MAKRKKRSKKSAKANKNAVKHTLPDGFWPQVSAVVLVVLALLLILGMMGSGGAFPVGTYEIARAIFGWAIFVLPVLFIFRAVQIFRAEENRIPAVVTGGTLLFITLTAGFVQLMSKVPEDYTLASAGKGGGVLGWLFGQGMLTLVDANVGALIALIGMFITSLFVLSVSPKTVLDWIVALFRREKDETAAGNLAVAQKAATEPKASTTIGELKLNEGVPTTMSDAGRSRIGSIRDGGRDKAAEEQAALTTTSDPDWQMPSIDLLEKKQNPADAGDVKHNAQIIKDTLGEFNIDVEMEGANIGPKVTQYTLKPPSGVKLTRITALGDEHRAQLGCPGTSYRSADPRSASCRYRSTKP